RHELVEGTLGGAGLDGVGRECRAVEQVGGLVGDDEGGGGVEHCDIAQGRALAGQHVADGGGVLLFIPALEVGELGGGEPGIGGRHLEHLYLPVLQLGDVGGPGRGQLVEAVVAVHHPHVLGAQVLQYVGDRLHPVPGEHA